jgi:hypothetical protein
LIGDPKQQQSLTEALKGSARPHAAKDVVTELEKLLKPST